ncbi:M23 family metallopeptidase [Deinococcus sp.]|uniref:M23 family metallopeptidase n=1 Tax=Deinococcus sp. TaxID=47478 RepID=UPI002869DBD7|nr:M23 family metallopeptidase [Deinococcus sp.]
MIGKVGSTGVSNAPHLHLELRVRGEAVQPTGWRGLMLLVPADLDAIPEEPIQHLRHSLSRPTV